MITLPRFAIWLSLSFPLITLPLQAQATGRVVGRVVDAEQGNPISGAQLEVIGTTLNATTALDGRYAIQGVPTGPVSIRARMIGFAPKLVTGVSVPTGGTVLQDIALTATAVQLAEIAVTAEAERGTVNRALDEQRNAINIVNSVSAEQIARSPDSDAGQAVQRVSGVTVQEGKYVFVRGLGERYTTTSLNGARIPSPEPERKVVPLDLFPSGLLEGIITSKTFTPDQPGDFSGAQVNLKTREFPATRVLSFSMSAGLNDAATGRNVFKAPTVGTEWAGFPGEERELPDPIRSAGNLSGVSQDQADQFVGMFRNAWSARNGNGSANGGLGASLGGEGIFGQPVGYLGSFNYSYGQEIRDEETRGLVVCDALDCSQVRPFNMYTGSSARNSVLWGGLLNLSTRLGSSSKISLNNTYSRTSENEGSFLQGDNEEFRQFGQLQITRLTFTARSVRSHQLQGEHLLGDRNFIDWSVGHSDVQRDEPDRSDLAYGTADPATGAPVAPYWVGTPRSAIRTFSQIDESGWDLGGNVRRLFGSLSRPITVKVGGAYRRVSRDADTRAYNINNRTLSQAELTASPEAIFDGSYAEQGRLLLFANANAGRYEARDQIVAGFAQAEVPLSERLQLVGGARLENWRLDVETRSVSGAIVPARPRQTDVLPALGLTYRLTDDQNFRLSASQTLARPEYRELSPVPYFEQIGLLTTFGNPDLERTLIQNLDARWEWFPRSGEVVSLGVFAKWFDQPIERVIIPQSGTLANSFVNADGANNYGIELEVRKGLDVLADGLAPFSVFANTTLMKSDIDLGANAAGLTNVSRPMAGQSEYVVNAGLTYTGGSGALSGTLLYNVTGRRVFEAGAGGLPDSYEEARHLVDVSLHFPIAGSLSGRADGKNLLNAPFRLSQGHIVRQRYLVGRQFSLGFTWQP
jgi:outer membrane receptor protein involved in Fe transport